MREAVRRNEQEIESMLVVLREIRCAALIRRLHRAGEKNPKNQPRMSASRDKRWGTTPAEDVGRAANIGSRIEK